MDLQALRSLVRDCIEKHSYRSAVFFGDKLCILSENDEEDVYLLCQAYYYSGQYKRALLHLTRYQQRHHQPLGQDSGAFVSSAAANGGGAESHHNQQKSGSSNPKLKEAFKYLTAKCLAECKEWERCLQILEEPELGEGEEGEDKDGERSEGNSYMSEDYRTTDFASFSERMEESFLQNTPPTTKGSSFKVKPKSSSKKRNAQVKKESLELESVMCVLRAKCYESMDNREKAKKFYIKALEQSDPFCYEALEALIGNHMLSSKEESALFSNLGITGDQHLWLKLLYECKGKKYGKVEEIQTKLQTLELTQTITSSSLGSRDRAGETTSVGNGSGQVEVAESSSVSSLSQSLDVRTCKAEFLYHCCEFRQCYEVTQAVLDQDPYFVDCLPVHLACACELGKKNDLFLLGHKLVEEHPNKAVSWFAVACYYMCISQYDSAERYFQKATNMEKDFAPAWIGYGHAFACQVCCFCFYFFNFFFFFAS